MLRLVSDSVAYPVEFDLEGGEGESGLREFGAKLDRGEYHLGVMWGLEYGWLRAQFPRLEAVAVASNGGVAEQVQLIARRDLQGRGLEDFKGKTLARCKHDSLMNRLFLDKLLKGAGYKPGTFFEHEETLHRNNREALLAVKRGEADCFVINLYHLRYLASSQGSLNDAIQVIETSSHLPEPVIAGRRDRVEQLRSGLWNEMKEVLVHVHNTEQGAQLVKFWRFRRFIEPNEEFLSLVDQRTIDYPVTTLINLAEASAP